MLLVLAAGLTLSAQSALVHGTAGEIHLRDLWPAALLCGLFLVIHLTLVLRRSTGDQVLLPILLALMGLGLVLSQRLAPGDLPERQGLWVVLGTVALGVGLHTPVDLRLLRRYRYSWALIGVGLVALTLVFGRGLSQDAPRLWLGVRGFQFQPSEILKLVLVVFLAGYLADKRELLSQSSTRVGPFRIPPLPYLAPLAVMLGGALALLAAQRDFGAALLLYAIGLGMLYLASGRLAYVVLGLGSFAAGSWLLHEQLTVIQVRAAIWLDPWSVAADHGYQLVQGLMAMAAGGVTGTGLGQGMPEVIPAVHTDFVYAAIVEELGLAGALAVLAIYGGLFWRGYRIGIRARGVFAGLLAGGLTLALAIQTFIIVAGILRIIPMTGITLPFLSHGGTSLLTSLAAAVILFRISEQSATSQAPPVPQSLSAARVSVGARG